MLIVEDTLDDLLKRVFHKIMREGHRVEGNRKGPNTELLGVLLELRNPRARLSRTETKGTLFSCLGETLWYLSGSDSLEFIEYYIRRYEDSSDDGKTIWGAYGPRMFKVRNSTSQIGNVIEALKKHPPTRQAVVQLFDADDLIGEHKDVPCTCVLQFFVRDNLLHLVTYMRSNDAFLGLPHDVFAFTFLQELIARSIGVEVGTYKHAAGSLHIYDDQIPKAKTFLSEGWQSRIAMPEMPKGEPWTYVRRVLEAETEIRQGQVVDAGKFDLPTYWKDLILLLQIYSKRRKKGRFKCPSSGHLAR